MELGSTAKVRTLINYLEIITALYGDYRGLPRPTLEAIQTNGDPLRRWAAPQLLEHRSQGLPGMLQAAMERPYSPSPGEPSFTSGLAHQFSPFHIRFRFQL